MDDGSTKEFEVTDQWKSLDLDTNTAATDGSSSGSEGSAGKENESEADAGQQSDASPADITDGATQQEDASSQQSGSNSSKVTPSEGSTETDGLRLESLPATEADRLYPYGMQITLPEDIDPEHVASIEQGATGSKITINLMQEPS